jgi:hypothetical protein
MVDKAQKQFAKQQAAIKAAHDRRVLAKREKAAAKGDKSGGKK